MKYHHQLQVCYEFTNKIRMLLNALHQVSLLCQQLDPATGDPLNMEEWTFDSVKQWIANATPQMYSVFSQLQDYIQSYPDCDFISFTNRNLVEWIADIDLVKFDCDRIANYVTSCNNWNQLGKIADYIESNITEPDEVVKSEEYKQLIIINDLLDAMFYALRGINPNNGQSLNLSDEEIRNQVTAYITTFNNQTYPFTGQALVERDLMVAVVDYVDAQLATGDLVTLSDYIGSGYERLPLTRRQWASV